MLAGGAAATLTPAWVSAIGPSSRFRVTRLVPPGHEPGRRHAERRLVWELLKRTSVTGDLDEVVVSTSDDQLFEHPFLLLAQEEPFDPLPDRDVARLRAFLDFGGFLLMDDCGAAKGSGVDRSMRRLLGRLYPTARVSPLPSDHTVYRSFYLLDRPYGRIMQQSYLEGVDREGLTPVIYSTNDLPGAWARDPLGTWAMPVLPGGEWQRERAIRMGVNLIMYALCLDYKKDQVHVETLMRRRRWRSTGGR